MALTPYRQQIGIPREAGGGVSDIVDTRVQDVSGSLDNLSKQMMAMAAPRLEEEAIRKAQEAGGSMILQRNEEGKLIAPERTLEGGIIYRQAFDKVIQARYLSEVGSDFQRFMDSDAAVRRKGDNPNKPYDAENYAETIAAYKRGMLEGVPAWLRAQTEELFNREADERVRAFEGEVSRNDRQNTINGVNQKIAFNRSILKDPDQINLMARNRNVSPDVIRTELKEQNRVFAQSLREANMMGGDEHEAAAMVDDNLMENSDNYYAGIPLVDELVDIISGGDLATLNAIKYGMENIDVEGATGLFAAGTVMRDTGVTEKVDSNLLLGATKQIFGFDANGGARPPDHPLSIKARKEGYISNHDTSGPGGGRAIDMRRIEGKTIEDAVVMWEKAGFDVTGWRDEYKNPVPGVTTGGHWHFSFGNQRKVMERVPVSSKAKFTVQQLSTLDPSHKRTVQMALTDREQRITRDEAEAREDARNRARIQAEQNEETQMRADIQFRVQNDLGGVYSTKEAQLIDSIALRDPNIDWSNLNSAQSRAGLLQHIRTYQRPPSAAISWMQNRIRSNDWGPAFELWTNIEATTVGKSNSRVGDLLLSKLDTRSKALFDYANSMHQNKESIQTITDALSTAVTGDGFTPDQAKARYNGQLGKEGNKSPFEEDKKDRVANLLGLSGSERANLSQDILDNIDASFAINYEILRDPEKALTASVRQTAKAYRRSPLFTGGVGPASLADNYSRAQLAQFLVNERVEGGGFLLPILPGGRKHLLGVNVKFAPIGNQTDRIGEYRVRIMDPDNLTVPIDSYIIDFGRYLPAYFGKQDPAVTVRNREQKKKEAGERATAGQDALIRMGQAADRGPKY